MLGRHNGQDERRWFWSRLSLGLSLSLSAVPTMGSACMPGRISMREEGGGDDGGGGVLGELELAEEVHDKRQHKEHC